MGAKSMQTEEAVFVAKIREQIRILQEQEYNYDQLLVYVSGIAACALAAWLSRGAEGEDPPDGGGDDPTDRRPPPDPDGLPEFDWHAFERQVRAYTNRSRQPAGAGR